MNAIVPFSFESKSIRALERDGEPWFVAKDVAIALGYSNHNDAVSRHCKRAISGGVAFHDPIGREQALTIIPESDVYRLIMRSKLPAAVRFEEWVTAEVLPAIRKTGGYGLPADFIEQMNRQFGIIKMLAHKVTELERSVPGIVTGLVEPIVTARLAEKVLITRRGKTAKQLWDAHGMPPKIKGITVWFGNRLEEMGCMSGRADRGDGAIRLFDPDKAAICMRNGLGHKCKVYASERMGQGRFKLVTP